MTTMAAKTAYGNPTAEQVDTVIAGHLVAFSWWCASTGYQLIGRGTPKPKAGLIGPKVDMGICMAMLAMFGSTLL